MHWNSTLLGQFKFGPGSSAHPNTHGISTHKHLEIRLGRLPMSDITACPKNLVLRDFGHRSKNSKSWYFFRISATSVKNTYHKRTSSKLSRGTVRAIWTPPRWGFYEMNYNTWIMIYDRPSLRPETKSIQRTFGLRDGSSTERDENSQKREIRRYLRHGVRGIRWSDSTLSFCSRPPLDKSQIYCPRPCTAQSLHIPLCPSFTATPR